MRKYLLIVLNYFAYFSYAPSFQELHTFFSKIITKKNLKNLVDEEIKQGNILRLPNNIFFGLSQQSELNLNLCSELPRYTLPQYSISIQNKSKSQIQMKGKWASITIQIYIFLLKICPTVLFVGVTGKSAMRGFCVNDDLDLFLITRNELLWTTRFFVILLAKILGIHTKTGICLNLFFDESDVGITQKKRNSYIAHEILQMKPIVDKINTYRRFLEKNQWIYQYFPNAKIRTGNQVQVHWTSNLMYKHIDHIFKSIQLPIIRRNNTALSISDTQLWLFKIDFEKKLKRRGLVI